MPSGSRSPGPDGPSRLRPTIQRILDQNPDGLDWLVLLDPFDEGYGGLPPESPLNGVKVASVITDLAPSRVDDRRLAPLRRHDAILAFSEETEAECRRRLPLASGRIERLGLGLDESWTGSDASEPSGMPSGEELARLGIGGPFLLANMASGADRSNLGGVLEAYRRLPVEHRQGHQLVIAGELDDPWAAVAYLHDQGAAEGLVLAGPVDEPTLRSLYSRCAAFVSPSFEEAATLSMVEALGRGSAVVAGRAGNQPEVLADAGLLADPDDPSEIAGQVTRVLDDVDLARGLRRKALVRSAQFPWDRVVEGFLAALQDRESEPSRPRLRFDRAHIPRSRIALFTASRGARSAAFHLDGWLIRAARAAFDVDRYFEAGDAALVERFPIDFGGFDARQFARNDDILGYRAVIRILPDIFSVKAKRGRLEARPALVFLRDESSLDRIGLEGPEAGPVMTEVEAEVACLRLRELFLTSSRLVVRSSRNLAAIRSCFPEFADQVVELGPVDPSRAARDLAELVECCPAARPLGLGRTWELGSPLAARSPGATEADESYLEAR